MRVFLVYLVQHLVPETIIASSFTSWGIAVALDEESVLAFIFAIIMLLVSKGQIGILLSLMRRRA
jgi:hypothetical protein